MFSLFQHCDEAPSKDQIHYTVELVYQKPVNKKIRNKYRRDGEKEVNVNNIKRQKK